MAEWRSIAEQYFSEDGYIGADAANKCQEMLNSQSFYDNHICTRPRQSGSHGTGRGQRERPGRMENIFALTEIITTFSFCAALPKFRSRIQDVVVKFIFCQLIINPNYCFPIIHSSDVLIVQKLNKHSHLKVNYHLGSRYWMLVLAVHSRELLSNNNILYCSFS